MTGYAPRRPVFTLLSLLTSVALSSCAKSGGESYTYVVDAVALLATPTRGADGVLTVEGFDIDGIDGPDPGELCRNRDPDFAGPDGQTGIDNLFATDQVQSALSAVAVVDGTALDLIGGILDDSIKTGKIVLLLQFDGVDSFENDDSVTLTYAVGKSAAVTAGPDGRLVESQTFERDPSLAPIVFRGRIRHGTLELDEFDITLKGIMRELPFVLPVARGRVRLQFNSTGTLSGVLGGGLLNDSLAALLPNAGIPAGAVALGRTLLRSMADTTNDDTGECDLLSFAMHIHGIRAYVVDGVESLGDAGVPADMAGP